MPFDPLPEGGEEEEDEESKGSTVGLSVRLPLLRRAPEVMAMGELETEWATDGMRAAAATAVVLGLVVVAAAQVAVALLAEVSTGLSDLLPLFGFCFFGGEREK